MDGAILARYDLQRQGRGLGITWSLKYSLREDRPAWRRRRSERMPGRSKPDVRRWGGSDARMAQFPGVLSWPTRTSSSRKSYITAIVNPVVPGSAKRYSHTMQPLVHRSAEANLTAAGAQSLALDVKHNQPRASPTNSRHRRRDKRPTAAAVTESPDLPPLRSESTGSTHVSAEAPDRQSAIRVTNW
jgi:hypothetical protein